MPTSTDSTDKRRRAFAIEMQERFAVVTRSWIVILQACVASTLAYAAAEGIGHVTPFFAPIAAVATVAVSLANRLRRAAELVIGNAVGILFADILIAQIGSGAWQIGLVVSLSLIAAIMLGGGPILIMQSCTAAVIIATISPPTAENPFYTDRFVDALIGGGIGLLISALLMPPDPTRTARQATEPVVATLAEGYRNISLALAARDGDAAQRTLAGLRGTSPVLAGFQDGLAATRESVRLVPWYWGQRAMLASYGIAGFHLDNALRNLRVLARQAANALQHGDALPEGLPQALEQLADAADQLPDVLAGKAGPAIVRDQFFAIRTWAKRVPETLAEQASYSAPMRVQIRLSVSDLLQATGLPRTDFPDAVEEPPANQVVTA